MKNNVVCLTTKNELSANAGHLWISIFWPYAQTMNPVGTFLCKFLDFRPRGRMFAGYVPLASQSPYPFIVYFLANYRPHLSHFLENVIFAIPTFYLLPFTLWMWFQEAKCNTVNASLLLNLINNNFLIFFNR